MSFVIGEALRREVAGNLATFERRAVSASGLRQAGVAIVIVSGDRDDSAHVLLTRRPDRLKRHGGQYALPGGRLEPGETPQAAALRELEEELGLLLDPDRVLGVLDDFATRSGFRITPTVVWGGARVELEPDPSEVERVFRIPLAELNRPEIPHLARMRGQDSPVLSAPLPTLGHHLYAPTAAMLYQFREVALRGESTRVAHYEQPRFAWK